MYLVVFFDVYEVLFFMNENFCSLCDFFEIVVIWEDWNNIIRFFGDENMCVNKSEEYMNIVCWDLISVF